MRFIISNPKSMQRAILEVENCPLIQLVSSPLNFLLDAKCEEMSDRLMKHHNDIVSKDADSTSWPQFGSEPWARAKWMLWIF